MVADHPASARIPQLRELWKLAFGDPDWFLDSFFGTAYAPDRCLCICEDSQPVAVLYWIDCTLEGRKFAYIYAVATHPDHRGKGLCRSLMQSAHRLLADRGYAGALLVPQKESLRKMYAGMGYRDAGGLNRFRCAAADPAAGLWAVGAAEFAALRRQFLPAGSVLQEGVGLVFLAQQLQFYAGEDFLLAAYTEDDTLHCMELLGDPASASGILSALKLSRGDFRTPGDGEPFAMLHPLVPDCPEPSYFGFAFD